MQALAATMAAPTAKASVAAESAAVGGANRRMTFREAERSTNRLRARFSVRPARRRSEGAPALRGGGEHHSRHDTGRQRPAEAAVAP